MSVNNDKPYVLRVAELIYSKVVDIKKKNPRDVKYTGIRSFYDNKRF